LIAAASSAAAGTSPSAATVGKILLDAEHEEADPAEADDTWEVAAPCHQTSQPPWSATCTMVNSPALP
jgi:hypothetical protein